MLIVSFQTIDFVRTKKKKKKTFKASIDIATALTEAQDYVV